MNKNNFIGMYTNLHEYFLNLFENMHTAALLHTAALSDSHTLSHTAAHCPAHCRAHCCTAGHSRVLCCTLPHTA
jgi:hypothetical protein